MSVNISESKLNGKYLLAGNIISLIEEHLYKEKSTLSPTQVVTSSGPVILALNPHNKKNYLPHFDAYFYGTLNNYDGKSSNADGILLYSTQEWETDSVARRRDYTRLKINSLDPKPTVEQEWKVKVPYRGTITLVKNGKNLLNEKSAHVADYDFAKKFYFVLDNMSIPNRRLIGDLQFRKSILEPKYSEKKRIIDGLLSEHEIVRFFKQTMEEFTSVQEELDNVNKLIIAEESENKILTMLKSAADLQKQLIKVEKRIIKDQENK